MISSLTRLAQQHHWSCVDEMQGVVQDVGLALLPLQLESGPFGGQLLTIALHPLHLVRFQVVGRVHSIGEKPRGALSVSVDLDPRPQERPWRSHGQPLPPDCLFGQGLERDIHITLPARFTLGMVTFPIEALRSWAIDLGWPGFDGELLPNQNVHLMHSSTASVLRRCLRRLFAMAERAPDQLSRPGTQRLVREDLIPLLLEALITGPAQPRPSRPPARIDLVKDIQRWLEAHPTTPVTLTDLCREGHACRRTLIQGFQEHLGMGPMAYVKLMRLHGIRRQLLQAEPGEVQIGALACGWGFHNAGHFAADYRRLFGESPRDTLRRSLRGLS